MPEYIERGALRREFEERYQDYRKQSETVCPEV